MQTLELLAPAKNLECGKAAISHGADAVYIGAARFGARAAAGNSVEDIAELCQYAHQYRAKVYVTVNTIIYDDELDDMRRLVDALRQAGVDALLVQDMGLAAPSLSGRVGEGLSLPLHASTQTDNRTAEKVLWLRSLGFRRVVLARELSLKEITAIHEAAPDVELEVFVHGALCVSYSGVCYASQYCFGRSANRGECAQFCRLKFDLKDADGQVVERQRHLLSLRDMCRIDRLEELAEAGACSFKIEGRLKDTSYVKNVVSAYSRRLDEVVARYPDRYRRASLGLCQYRFEPNLRKTFNRGFTEYFLDGRKNDIASPDTPKAMGEYVGKVKEIRGGSFNVAGTATFANGDGLCFINHQRELEGFRVNRAEGNRLFPMRMLEGLRPGMALYRNNNVAFERLLSGVTAERRIPIRMTFAKTTDGFSLSAQLADGGAVATVGMAAEHQIAEKPQHDNIVRQLTRLGNTPYSCDEIKVTAEAEACFIPSSQLAELRRQLVDALGRVVAGHVEPTADDSQNADGPLPATPYYDHFPYLYNIANRVARDFYRRQGLATVADAFELEGKGGGADESGRQLLMQCRHCIRYTLGYCVRHGGRRPTWREPLYLELADRRRFQLEFDCKHCQMNVYGG